MIAMAALARTWRSANIPTSGPAKAGGPPSFPSDPLACSSSTLRGRFANLCTGGLSPGRIRIGNLCFISVPLELLAEPDLMAKPSLQTLQVLGWRAKHHNAFCPHMPAVRVFHRG